MVRDRWHGSLWRGAAIAGTVLVLGACGASGGGASVQDVASTSPITTDTAATSSSSGSLDRDALRGSVEEAMADTSFNPTTAQIDCYTESLIDEIGLARLAAVGVPAVDPLSTVVLSRMTTNIDDAAAYFTPIFTCLDGDSFIRDSVTDLPPAVQDCVVDAVLADREVRVIYVLGTKEGSGPNEELERMTAPLIERNVEIQDDCIAQS